VFRNIPPVTRTLILINIGVFLLQDIGDDQLVSSFALWPWHAPLFHAWQIITYAFLHDGFSHLFFNMFGLFMFGPEIEHTLGSRHYLVYYFVCVIGAALMHLAVMQLMSAAWVPTLGASGGVFGLLLAFATFFPQRRILLLIPPIPMKAWVFVTLYGVAELALGVFGTMQGVAHFAHLGGMLAGFLLLMYWQWVTPSEH
jgi:membrane associated rhomboid family serine protease